ncbi:MAG: hypothetical protein WDN25_15150 [Acetobacteraceae bacterium]
MRTTCKDLERELLAMIRPAIVARIALGLPVGWPMSRPQACVSVLAAAKQIRTLRGGFAIFGAEAAIQRVFDISGFSRIIPMVASEAEALQAIGR